MRTDRMMACAAALVAIAVATTASARPGTPNHEAASSSAPGAIDISWTNTANEGGVVFDIEGMHDRSIANFDPYHPGPGQWNYSDGTRPLPTRIGVTYSYHYTGLPVGGHCFRVWARVGAQGLRSEQPSAWACATVRPASSYPPPPPPSPYHVPNGPVGGTVVVPGCPQNCGGGVAAPAGRH